MSVRLAGVCAECDDRRERKTVRAELTHLIFEFRRKLFFGNARFDFFKHSRESLVVDCRRFFDERKFLTGFYHARFVQSVIDRHEFYAVESVCHRRIGVERNVFSLKAQGFYIKLSDVFRNRRKDVAAFHRYDFRKVAAGSRRFFGVAAVGEVQRRVFRQKNESRVVNISRKIKSAGFRRDERAVNAFEFFENRIQVFHNVYYNTISCTL